MLEWASWDGHQSFVTNIYISEIIKPVIFIVKPSEVLLQFKLWCIQICVESVFKILLHTEITLTIKWGDRVATHTGRYWEHWDILGKVFIPGLYWDITAF